MNEIIRTLKVVFVGLLLTFGANSMYAQSGGAWKGPTATPPNGNVPAPINVGADQQDKIGSLRVGGFRSFGPALFDSNVGIGTFTPTQRLDIVAGKVRIADGTQGTGKVFTSDASGVGSWQVLSGGGGTSNPVVGLSAPDYDSGWVTMKRGETKTLTHNLGTEETMVYIEGKTSRAENAGINVIRLGGDDSSGDNDYGFMWSKKTSASIDITRWPQDYSAEQIRIRIWKIGAVKAPTTGTPPTPTPPPAPTVGAGNVCGGYFSEYTYSGGHSNAGYSFGWGCATFNKQAGRPASITSDKAKRESSENIITAGDDPVNLPQTNSAEARGLVVTYAFGVPLNLKGWGCASPAIPRYIGAQNVLCVTP